MRKSEYFLVSEVIFIDCARWFKTRTTNSTVIELRVGGCQDMQVCWVGYLCILDTEKTILNISYMG